MFDDINAEAETLRLRFLGNIDGLATELARICLIKSDVVYRVFQILDVNATISVGFSFLNKSTVLLTMIANSRDGLILCQQLYKWLSELSLPNAIFQPKNIYPNEFNLRLLKSVIDTAKPTEENTQPRKLSDVEMDWYANYNQTDAIFYERDRKTGILHSYGGTRNNFDSNVCWELPTQGIGFVIYKRDDLKNIGSLKDKLGLDQVGTKETIDAMIRIAIEWNLIHSDRLLQYGDISRPGGVNTPDHGTHNNGKVFDVRPLRNDSQIGDAANLTWNSLSYDRDLTKEFIRLIRRLYLGTKFFFNDVKILSDTEFSSFVEKRGGHDNHLHVIFPGGD